MRTIYLLLIPLALAFTQSPATNGKGWRGIVPLHSVRADVERLLGPPSADRCKCYYDGGDVGVFINYSTGSCERGKSGRWDVPRDTVISMSVYSVRKPPLSELRLDLTKFERTEDPELPGYVTYSNDEEGVSYEVSDKGRVQGISYYPAAKDKHLRCSDPAPNSGMHPTAHPAALIFGNRLGAAGDAGR